MTEPKISGKININLTEIVGLILATALLVFVGYLLVKHFKGKHELEGEEELAGTDEIKSGGIEIVAKAVPEKDRKKVQANLHKFDPKPIADLIYDAHGTFNDDEDSVYTAMASLKSKAELALLSLYFKMLYKKELFTYIQSFLDASELTKVNDIVKKLPKY